MKYNKVHIRLRPATDPDNADYELVFWANREQSTVIGLTEHDLETLSRILIEHHMPKIIDTVLDTVLRKDVSK